MNASANRRHIAENLVLSGQIISIFSLSMSGTLAFSATR